MSFLTAILGAAGGFGAGRQQAQQTQFQENMYQQQEADRQKQLQMQSAQWRETQRQALANRGINPDTATWDDATQTYSGGTPFVMPQALQRYVPGNVGTKYQVTPMDMYNHYNALANWYLSTGQTDRANLATQQAGDIYNQMAAAQTAQNTMDRDLIMAGVHDQYTRGIYRDFGVPGERESFLENWLTSRGYPPYTTGGAGSPLVNMGRNVSALQRQQVSTKADFTSTWDQMISYPNALGTGMTKTGAPGVDPSTHKIAAPLINQYWQGQMGSFQTALNSSQNPTKDAQTYINGIKNNPEFKSMSPKAQSGYIESVNKYARYRQSVVDYGNANTRLIQATQNPQSYGPLMPVPLGGSPTGSANPYRAPP